VQDRRFSGKAGDDYELFKPAIPWHDDFQAWVGELVAEHHVRTDVLVLPALELGVGTANTTLPVLHHATGIPIVGVDNEPTMLEQARINLPADGSVTLHEADILTFLLSQKEDSFGSCFTAWTLHNLKRTTRQRVYRELARVLQPGAVLVQFDKIVRSADLPCERHADFSDQIQRVIDVFEGIGRPDLVSEWVMHYLEDEHPDVVMTEPATRQDLFVAGFPRVTFYDRKGMDVIMSAHLPIH
jgi:tRNA (cmo5U34)-methyltransferase